MALVLLVPGLSACGGPPEPKNPEMLQDGPSFRPLADVPERPLVTVPIGDREALINELRENNRQSRRMRLQQGYDDIPVLPSEEPEEPMTLEETQQEGMGE